MFFKQNVRACMLDFAFCSPGTSVAVSSILIVLIMVGRAAFVFPLSFLINLFKKNKSEKLSLKKHVFCFCHSIIFFLSYFIDLPRHANNFLVVGGNMVGWSHERCCVYGTRL